METTTTQQRLFSNRDLVLLIVPLVVEQLLAVAIGMVDTLMVASVGEAAVSGISIVDTINILLINIFTSMATGGAVVAAQYLGREDYRQGRLSANQLIFSTTALALVIMTICLVGQNSLLEVIYGRVDPEVMANARVYLFWSALSYPCLALYNGGAAIFRAMGNSKVSMFCSIMMNIINVSGNAILIFGYGMGVAGAAIATLVSRTAGAVVVTCLLCNPHCVLRLDATVLRPKLSMIRRIMRLAVPNGLESSMFQVGKILVQRVVTAMGTMAIAANAVANTLGGFPNIAGNAIGLAVITVVGQCMGAGRKDEAQWYINRLMKVSYLAMGVINLALMLLARPMVGLFVLQPGTGDLTVQIIVTYCIASIFLWVPSFLLPNGLRAAGDAQFTLGISTFSMWVFRVASCYLFCGPLGMGVLGAWFAMYTDWLFRGICFLWRYHSGRWQNKRVI